MHTTRRPVVPEVEEILFEAHPVLDHGFVRVIDYMGNDSAIVQAARVSYGKGTKTASDDRALIHYLLRHKHTTPFEMLELKLHVKLPIFVARQWIRHRTASVNEYSARYSILDREFYIPAVDHIAGQSAINRQGRSQKSSESEGELFANSLSGESERAYQNYLWALNEDSEGTKVDESREGIARELARIGLTLNTYTQWYWKTDLHNLMNFLRLRADAHAQYEIRAYANVLLGLVRKWVPIAFEAFVEHQLEAVTVSKSAIEVLRRRLRGERVTQENSGLSKREWSDLSNTMLWSESAQEK